MGGGKWPPRVREGDAEGEGGVEASWELLPLSPSGSDSEHSDTERLEDEETKQLKGVDTEQSENKDAERLEHGLRVLVSDGIEISGDVCALCDSVVADVDSPPADVDSPPADGDSLLFDVESPPADVEFLPTDVGSHPVDVERPYVPETTSDDGHLTHQQPADQTAELTAELTADRQQQEAKETAGEGPVAAPVACPDAVDAASHAANEGGDGTEGILSEGGKDDKSEGSEIPQEQEKMKSVLLLVEADLSSASASGAATASSNDQAKLAQRLAGALLHSAGATPPSPAGTDASPPGATSPAPLPLRPAVGEGSLGVLPAVGELSSSLLVVPFAPAAADFLLADILASGLEPLPAATADVDNLKTSSQSADATLAAGVTSSSSFNPVPPVHVSVAVLVLSATDLNEVRLLLCEREEKRCEKEEGKEVGRDSTAAAAAAAALVKQLREQYDVLRLAFRYIQGAPPIALLDTHCLSPDTFSHCRSFLLSSLHLPSSWPVLSIPSLLKPPGELDSPAPANASETEGLPEKSPEEASAAQESPEESPDNSNSSSVIEESAHVLCPTSVGALLCSVMHISSLSLELQQVAKKIQAGAQGVGMNREGVSGADTSRSTESTQSKQPEDSSKWAALWHAADALSSGRLSHTLTTVTPHLHHLHQMYLPFKPHLHQFTLHLDHRFPSLRPRIRSLYCNPRRLVLPLSLLLLALLLLSFLLSGLVFFALRSWVYHGAPLPFPFDLLLSPVFEVVAAVCGCNSHGRNPAAGAAGAASGAGHGGCSTGPYFGPYNNEDKGGWGSFWPSSHHHHRQHYYYRTRWAPAR